MKIPQYIAKVVGPSFVLLLSGCIAQAASLPREGDDSTGEATSETSEPLTASEYVRLSETELAGYCARHPKVCELAKEKVLELPDPPCLSCPPDAIRPGTARIDPQKLRDMTRPGSAAR